MREYTAPEVVGQPGPDLTMAHAVTRHQREAPDAVLFSRRTASGWAPVTAAQFAHEVAAVARGLIAAGIQPGDRVALMSATRYEWTLIDYAIWTVGAVTVPVYETSSAEQLHWILSDSGARAAVFEKDEHLAIYACIQDRAPLAHHWQLDGAGLDELVAGGRHVSDDELDGRLHSRKVTDVATLVYTSGTTGPPKGCALTHHNLWYTAVSAAKVLPELFNDQGSTLLFLPLAHVFGRLIQNACFENRVRVGHTADITGLVGDLSSFAPTFVLAVPRVFEKVLGTYRQRARDSRRTLLFDRGEKVAIAYSRALDGSRPSRRLAAEHALFERFLYGPRLRAPLGGRLTYAVCGGAPLGERLAHFFRGIGITVLEGYGLTETAAAGTVNTPAALKIGTVGRPSPGCAVRIAAEDDEILIRSRAVFDGYWHNPSASRQVLQGEWFRTGDIGALDDDGFLHITGRKKEILVTAAGKNVAPAALEDRIREHPLISHTVVIGDNERFIAALVTLDLEALARWVAQRGKPAGATAADLSSDIDLRVEVQQAIDNANTLVSRAEAIKEFRILPVDFSERSGTLTPSLKVKRDVVLDRYAATVDSIYGR